MLHLFDTKQTGTDLSETRLASRIASQRVADQMRHDSQIKEAMAQEDPEWLGSQAEWENYAAGNPDLAKGIPASEAQQIGHVTLRVIPGGKA